MTGPRQLVSQTIEKNLSRCLSFEFVVSFIRKDPSDWTRYVRWINRNIYYGGEKGNGRRSSGVKYSQGRGADALSHGFLPLLVEERARSADDGNASCRADTTGNLLAAHRMFTRRESKLDVKAITGCTSSRNRIRFSGFRLKARWFPSICRRRRFSDYWPGLPVYFSTRRKHAFSPYHLGYVYRSLGVFGR